MSELFYFFIICLSVFLFTFGCPGSSLLCQLSLVAVNEAYSSLWRMGFSLQWLLTAQALGHVGFQSCGSQA